LVGIFTAADFRYLAAGEIHFGRPRSGGHLTHQAYIDHFR
jgi:hypothetical protein